MTQVIENVRLVLQNTVVDGYLVIEGKTIASLGTGPVPAGLPRFDGQGFYLGPGFIDIHNHGRRGADCMSGRESLEIIAEDQLAHGVTGFLAGSWTKDWSSEEEGGVLQGLRAMAEYSDQGENSGIPRSRCLGIYSESTFFSQEKRGAHNPKYLQGPSLKRLEELLEAGKGWIRILALAPELPDAPAAIGMLKKAGLLVSAAHSNASLEEALEGINRGITLSTHTFNGMRGLHHQEPGIAGAVLYDDRVFCELIADGVHVHPLMLSLVYRLKGPDRIILVSDSVKLNGVDEGCYRLDGHTVTVKDGTIRLEDGRLAGSSLSLNRAVRTMIQAGIPLYEAVRMASLNPARILGLEGKKGSLAAGKDADLVLFDDDLTVTAVFLGGICHRFI